MDAGKKRVKPFAVKVPEKKLMADLKLLREKALELGASGAEIIPANQLVVDERVRLKCVVPRCLRAGETPNCPPNAPDLDLVRKAFARYSWGILLKTLAENSPEYNAIVSAALFGIIAPLYQYIKTSPTDVAQGVLSSSSSSG